MANVAKSGGGERVEELALPLADDWHHHFRDGAGLADLIGPAIVRCYGRAIAMPNLKPPVTTTARALEYYEEIKAATVSDPSFEPLMTLYLTDNTTPEEVVKAKASGKIFAFKLYPAGATTNSDSGVTDFDKVMPALRQMAESGILLLVHSEVTDPSIDVFDREMVFMDRILKRIVEGVPSLKVVAEHITTKEAVDFVMSAGPNVAATITAHHLLYNRNEIFKGGLRPHMYCLPVLKREAHRQALLRAIQSGSPKFFLGTDSAAHPQHKKESCCGCAGIYTAHCSLELYAEVFEQAGCLGNLLAFACHNGPDFYGLPRADPTPRIRLIKKSWTVPETYNFGGTPLVPLRAGDTVTWTAERI